MFSVPRAALGVALLLCLCCRQPAAWPAPRGHMPTRCQCLKFQERVLPRAVVEFQFIAKGAHCHRHEIILTVMVQRVKRETCLDISKRQAMNLLRCWERKMQEPQQLRICMRSGPHL